MSQLTALTPFTQLDYPGELACVAWFSGCNLRCVYCHNPDIVLKHGQKKDEELLGFLEARRGLLTAVVFSGGEASFCPRLPALARQAKVWGYKVKLDTNGGNPAMLRTLVGEGLIDAVALDYKAPPHRAERIVGTARYTQPFRESLAYLIAASLSGKLQLEIRTTCPGDFLDEEDLSWIIADLDRSGYTGTYWLQSLVASGAATLGNIPPPRHALDFTRLPQPKRFRLGFRNFGKVAA